MTTVLLTLGRLPKGLELARCLHRAGCRVLVAEPFGLHLCKISRAVSRSFRVTSPNEDAAAYASDLAAIIDAEGVDLVVPVSEEVLHVARVAEGYDGKARFVCPPFKTVLALHDKSAFIETAQSLRLAVPETARADTEEAKQILASGEAVMKPALGCAGSKLSFHAPQTLPHESALTNDMIVQRRIRGREVSVLSLARDGEVLMSTTYEGLVHSGTVAVAFRRVTDCPAVDMWVKTFVARTGYSGFIAFDVMIDEAGTPFVIECNPRLTSGLHFFDHAGLAAAFLDGRPPRLAHKPQLTLQEGHTALAIAYTHILRPQEFFRRVKDVFTTRHVLWAWRDPLPFCLMTTASWPMVRKVLFGGMTLAEAATADIEWTGKVTSPASSERR